MRADNDYAKRLGDRLKALRLARKLTQAQVGELLGGIEAETIGRYERGARLPKPTRIDQLLVALDVSLDDFLQGMVGDDPNRRSVLDLLEGVEDEELPHVIALIETYLAATRRDR